MLTGQDRITNQLIAREALKGDGLAHTITGSSHNAIGKGLRVGALLKLIGWKLKEATFENFGVQLRLKLHLMQGSTTFSLFSLCLDVCVLKDQRISPIPFHNYSKDFLPLCISLLLDI